MSALDIEWHLPVAPDGPKPVQILLDWLALNGVVYHASTHQREVLRPLCAELNARGVRCEADQILDYVSFLQEVVHDAASTGQTLPEQLRPYQAQLQQLLFKDGRLEDGGGAALPLQLKARARPSSRLSWLKPSAIGGPSAMEVLVEWLRENYTAYTHSTKKGVKGRMLEQLVDVIKEAGHLDCAVNTVRSKIDVLQREVRGEKARSTAYEQFGAVLEEIFTVGDAAEDQDDVKREDEDHDMEQVDFREHAGEDQEPRLPPIQSSVHGEVKLSLAEKIARSSPTGRLSWMKPPASGGPCAMELLVEWMEDNYASYTHSAKKGDKGRMLAKLLRQIEANGHRGCTIHAIRVKIDSLQRQVEGKSRPSAAFDTYGESLRRVFAEKDIVTPKAISPRVAVNNREDAVSHKSDEDQEGSEENTSSFLTACDENPVSFVLEQADMNDIENRGVGNANTHSFESSPGRASNPFSSDAEEERTEQAKGNSSPKVLHERIDLAKVNASPKLQERTELANGNASPKILQETIDLAKVNTRLEVLQSKVPPVNSPSTNEIVRIATLLRERHDLHQRGVPQDQIDKFLPLPDV
ncbi:Leucine--tRNA ligase [Phytophthora cinnamomi]|uniref:Leucine--tRNA ligase n=1 Tax=Phytophthora cinnamomi TaxID=4785 RepID=UPI0035599AB6|nr:Leucine--tRNA ligase [Phytophthora cinnamomi]